MDQNNPVPRGIKTSKVKRHMQTILFVPWCRQKVYLHGLVPSQTPQASSDLIWCIIAATIHTVFNVVKLSVVYLLAVQHTAISSEALGIGTGIIHFQLDPVLQPRCTWARYRTLNCVWHCAVLQPRHSDACLRVLFPVCKYILACACKWNLNYISSR